MLTEAGERTAGADWSLGGSRVITVVTIAVIVGITGIGIGIDIDIDIASFIVQVVAVVG